MSKSEENQYAPLKGCRCHVCIWANQRIERDRRLDADLFANYGRYLSGELVSRDDKE